MPDPANIALHLIASDKDMVRLQLVYNDEYNIIQHAKVFYKQTEQLILLFEDPSWIIVDPIDSFK
jgi:hypothetical protein